MILLIEREDVQRSGCLEKNQYERKPFLIEPRKTTKLKFENGNIFFGK